MSDRELLEMAAKAAGLNGYIDESFGILCFVVPDEITPKDWNPLTDDGDALRLAVKLGIGLLPKAEGVRGKTAICAEQFGWHIFDGEPDDPYAATRRAIVRAAAEIGKAMP